VSDNIKTAAAVQLTAAALLLLLYCCCCTAAALLMLYCCFTVDFYCCFTAALLLFYCCFTDAVPVVGASILGRARHGRELLLSKARQIFWYPS
jgi:hypothetical protein